MAIIAREPENDGVDLLAPDGIQAAVCCDVEDLGMVHSEFYGKTQHKVKLHFLLAKTIPARFTHPHTNDVTNVPESLVGRPFGLSRKFTLSLGDKAALRQFLKTWRGKDLNAEERRGFDLEKLIGASGALTITHNYSQQLDRWFANIDGISRLPDGWEAPVIPDDYKRRSKREDDGARPQPVAAGDVNGRGPDGDWSGEPIPTQDIDDDLPF